MLIDSVYGMLAVFVQQLYSALGTVEWKQSIDRQHGYAACLRANVQCFEGLDQTKMVIES